MSSPDPWSDELPPPRWLGQQAGCVVAALVGALGVVLLAGFLIAAWVILHGG